MEFVKAQYETQSYVISFCEFEEIAFSMNIRGWNHFLGSIWV